MIDPPTRQLGTHTRAGISPRVLGIGAIAVVTAVIAFAALGGNKAKTATGASSTSAAEVEKTSAVPTTLLAGLPPLPSSPKPMPDDGLYSGRPPMFVVVSFDGAADQSLLAHWSEVTKKAQAHMSLFLSGVYLLGAENKDAYHGPRHGVGESGINLDRKSVV